MPEVLEAHRAYKKTDEDALLMRFRARARLGRAVVQTQRGTPGAVTLTVSSPGLTSGSASFTSQ